MALTSVALALATGSLATLVTLYIGDGLLLWGVVRLRRGLTYLTEETRAYILGHIMGWAGFREKK